AVAATHEIFLDRRHRTRRACRQRAAGDHPPGLRDRIDPALVVPDRPERRAVVEVGAPVPVAVPGALEGGLERAHVMPPRLTTLRLAAQIREARELPERGVQEPAEPDGLAASRGADPVHAVVPVARPDERETVLADGEAVIERPRTMLEQRRALVRD